MFVKLWKQCRYGFKGKEAIQSFSFLELKRSPKAASSFCCTNLLCFDNELCRGVRMSSATCFSVLRMYSCCAQFYRKDQSNMRPHAGPIIVGSLSDREQAGYCIRPALPQAFYRRAHLRNI